MSSMKGFPSTDKVVSSWTTSTKNEYATLQPTGSKRVSLDTIQRSVVKVATGLTIAAGTKNVPGGAPVIVTAGFHNAKEGDMMRISNGVWIGVEISILRILTPISFEVGVYLPPNGVIGSNFDLFIYATTEVSSAGGLIVSTAPITVLEHIMLDYSVINITKTAWTEVLADSGTVQSLKAQIFDGSGYINEIGLGLSGSEISVLFINPGGNGYIDFIIPPRARISVRSVDKSTITIGQLVMNLMG